MADSAVNRSINNKGDGLNAALSKSSAASDEAIARIKKNDAEMDSVLSEKLPPLPEVTKLPDLPGPFQPPKNKDPKHAFLEIMPMLGVLAGAFVKNSSVASINAATAAMKAVKENNQEALASAHQQWLDNMDYVIKASEQQAREIKTALDVRGQATSERAARLQEIAAKSNNANMMAMIANGQFGDVYKVADLMERRAASLREYKIHVEEMNSDPKKRAFHDFVEQYKKEHNGASPPADAESQFIRSSSGFSTRAAQAAQSAFYKIPVVHNYQVIQGMWPRLQTALDQIKTDPRMKKDQAVQLDVLDTYIQMANGGRQVTEAQIGAFSHEPGYLGLLAKQYASVQAGQFLTTQQVDSLLKQGTELQKHSEDALAPTVKDQIRTMTARGIDPEEVIPGSLLDKYGGDAPSAPIEEDGYHYTGPE